jgi:hypothetical protein
MRDAVFSFGQKKNPVIRGRTQPPALQKRKWFFCQQPGAAKKSGRVNDSVVHRSKERKSYRHHGMNRDWDAEMESKLRNDWGDDTDWQQHRAAVRRGWLFGKNESCCGDSCKHSLICQTE